MKIDFITKLLSTRSVDYLEQPGQDIWREAEQLSLESDAIKCHQKQKAENLGLLVTDFCATGTCPKRALGKDPVTIQEHKVTQRVQIHRQGQVNNTQVKVKGSVRRSTMMEELARHWGQTACQKLSWQHLFVFFLTNSLIK